MASLMLLPFTTTPARAPVSLGVLPEYRGMRYWRQAAQRGDLGAPQRGTDGLVLLANGDAADQAFLLTQGCVELLHRTESGGSVVFKVLVAPTLFGALEQLGGENDVLATARVLGGATFYRMDRDTFGGLLVTDPRLAFELLVDTSASFCVTSRLASGRLFDTDTQLANLMCSYLDLFGQPVVGGIRVGLRRSQADLAASLGAGERSVNRVLSAWRDEGLIFKQAGHYIVTNKAALEAKAGELRHSLIHGGDLV